MVGGVLHRQAGTQMWMAIVFQDVFSLFEDIGLCANLLVPELVRSVAQSLRTPRCSSRFPLAKLAYHSITHGSLTSSERVRSTQGDRTFYN